MPYCTNCGRQLSVGAKYCSECGTPTSQKSTNTRRHEYAGTIIKCPSCGTEIPSFTAFCPSCGHEINSARIPPAIKEFSTQINNFDSAISSTSSEPQRGWQSWGKLKKVGWVILNIYTFCIPLLIYLLSSIVFGRSSFTPEEKKKAQYIKNYTFPNDRETILEGLLFIKAQVSALSSGKKDRHTARWIKIWKSAAKRLIEKAEILFKGDSIAANTFSDIVSEDKKVKLILFIRGIAITLVVLIILLPVVHRVRSWQPAERPIVTYEWPTSGIALQLPIPPSTEGEIDFNDEKNYWIDVKSISEEQYHEYLNECIDRGFVTESVRSGSSIYRAYNQDGYYLYLSHSGKTMTIHVKAPEIMSEIRWPQNEIARRMPVPESSIGIIFWESDNGFRLDLGNMSLEAYNQYVDECYEAGFSAKYSRRDTSFSGTDAQGFHININYEGNRVISIEAKGPKKE